ncbi:MAG: MFS transporter [Spirochaetaceae bacterium]|nr:MFS transporter [Spirochaetaceae bacterium]
MAEKVEKIGMGERVGYGCGDMACNFIYQTIMMYITMFYTDFFGLTGKAVGIMFLVSRVWDAVNDPIMGSLVDKFHFKHGKYRPYLLLGIFPFIVLSVLCFTVPDFFYAGKVVYAYVTYIALTMVYTFINIPYGALTSAMTRDQDETAKITSIRMLMANGGGVIIAYFVPFLAMKFADVVGKQNSYMATMLVMGVIGSVLLFICYKTTKERVVPVSEDPVKFSDIIEQFKVNKPLVVLCVLFATNFACQSINGAVGAYYMKYNLGRPEMMGPFNLIGSGLAVLCFPFVPAAVRKIGKKPFMYLGLGIFIIGTLGFFFVPAPTAEFNTFPLIIFCKFLTAIGGLTGGYAWALVPEAITYGEYKLGKRAGGIIYAAVGFFFKLGMAVGGLMLGFGLDSFGFIPNDPNPSPEVLKGILVMFSIVPAILMVVMLITIKIYQLDDKRYAEIVADVEAKANAAHGAA